MTTSPTTAPELWKKLLGTIEGFDTARLARSRMASRGATVLDLSVPLGRIEARVALSGARNKVVFNMPVLDEYETMDLLQDLVGEAGSRAAILAGTLPPGSLGASLFPAPGSLSVSCTCQERVFPCSHVVATAQAVERELTNDPFLLAEAAGLPRSELLAAARDPELSMSCLTEMSIGTYLGDGTGLEDLNFRARAANRPMELIKELGPPPAAESQAGFIRALRGAYTRATRAALQLARNQV